MLPNYGTDQPAIQVSPLPANPVQNSPEETPDSTPHHTPTQPPQSMPSRPPTEWSLAQPVAGYRARVKPPPLMRAFLEGVFGDPAVVQYVYDAMKPDCPQDLQLAESEAELHLWLPSLHAMQARKLWLAVSDLPTERTPLLHVCVDSDSSTSCSENHPNPTLATTPHAARLPSVPAASFVNKVEEEEPRASLPRPGSWERLWPQRHDQRSFMTERSHVFPPGLLWIDVSGEPLECRPPSWEEDYSEYLEELASMYKLHPASIKDCLTPGELPKTEFTDGVTFCLMRYCVDQPIDAQEDDISYVSSKLVVIITSHPAHPEVDVVIAIHLHPLRRDPTSTAFEGYYEMQSDDFLKDNPEMTRDHLVNILFDDVLETYQIAINKLRALVDEYEKRLTQWTETDVTKELYSVRRRVSVYKRLLQMTQQSIQKYVKHVFRQSGHDPFAEDLRDMVKSLLFSTEDLYECTTELLNLHISLTSHRSNHLLYVLTILTVMFTPLTFIGTIYGMNFENMPEVHWRFGYVYCLCLMLTAVITTVSCLRHYGFICVRQQQKVGAH